MRKPRIFIASSQESLEVADAMNVNLDHQAEVTVWKNGFSLSTNTIDALTEKASSYDFAIFVFTPDDVATIRDKEKLVVRDNVLFELGLFIGCLGKERCYIVKPRDVELHFPTDLLGLTPADYDGKRSDGDLASAVNHPCVLIKTEVARLGLISQDSSFQKARKKSLPSVYKLGETEHELLKRVLANYSRDPDGVSIANIFSEFKGVSDSLLSLAAIKLERLNLIEKSIASSQYGDYFTCSITADGIDYLLENEHLFDDDKIPF